MGLFQEPAHRVTVLLGCVTLVCGSIPHTQRGAVTSTPFRTRGCAGHTRGRRIAEGGPGASLGLRNAQLQQDPCTWGAPWAQTVPGQTRGRARSAQAAPQTPVWGGDNGLESSTRHAFEPRSSSRCSPGVHSHRVLSPPRPGDRLFLAPRLQHSRGGKERGVWLPEALSTPCPGE